MKHQPLLIKTYLFTCIFIFAICFSSLAQLPKTNRALYFGVSSVDLPIVIKLNTYGNLEWQKCYGGSGLNICNHISSVNADRSYLIAASSSTNNSDISGNHGTCGYTDVVLMKINSSGILHWSKCFDKSKNEELPDFQVINGKIFAT